MLIWLITIGEPLPTQGNDRLHRAGMLTNFLISGRHDVVWWSSTFDHFRKKHHYDKDTFIDINDHFKLNLLHSIKYAANISVSRLINHYWIARKFISYSRSFPKPDIILCSFPTIELSAAAVAFGKQRGIPVVIDVRDLWPDIFCDILPNKLRWLGKIVLYPLFSKTKKALSECSSIIAVSDGYLKWGLSYAGRPKGKFDAVFPLGYETPVSSQDKLEIAGAAMQKLGVNASKTICWFIGTFGQTYDLRIIIEAAHYLKSQDIHSVQFVLSGDGEKYQEWFAMAKGLDNVVFTGWLDADNISYLMSIADIGLAAYAEGAPQGLPNKFFEYICAGLPILSSLSGEAEEFLKENRCGLTYKSGNIKSFSNQLMHLIKNDELRKEMSLNGELVFKKNYSADIVYSNLAGYLVEQAHTYSQTAK